MTDLLDVLTDLRREVDRTSGTAGWQSACVSDPVAAVPDLDDLTGPELRDTLLQRRSRRFFTDAPVRLEEVTAMVAAGLQMDSMLWPQLHRRQPLQMFVAARAVTGLPPAVYAMAGPEPLPVADLPPDEGLAAMVLQPEFAQAAALLVVTGSLAGAVAAEGGHGHRLLLERSGAVAETAWLAGVRRGLGGSIFAGFLPTALRNLAGVDGFHSTQLLALAIGHPAGTAGPDTVSASG